MAKEIGSEGQTRKTSAEWAASTDTYPQGHRLMNTTTGEVRISKGSAGNTWATAWQQSGSSEGGGTWGSITGTLSDQTDLQNILETQASAIGAVSDEVDALETTIAALATVAVDRTGSAVAFDVYAIYNSAEAPTSGTVTADYTGAVAGTSVECWWNHGAEPSWPSGWTVIGTWDNAAVNKVVLTYHGGTTVSGIIESAATGAATNGPRTYFPSTAFAVTSTTPLVVSGISGITIKAGQKYTVILNLRGTCSGTSGGYIGFWANTGTDHIVHMAGRVDFTANAGTYITPGEGYNNAATSYAWFAATRANNFGYIIGTIKGGAADATFELRARSVNGAQTFTIYADGSSLTLIPG